VAFAFGLEKLKLEDLLPTVEPSYGPPANATLGVLS
jgi:hypothetical protein